MKICIDETAAAEKPRRLDFETLGYDEDMMEELIKER